MFDGKVILITGGTGSFGKKLTEMLLKNAKPEKIVIFSRDEMKQWEMQQDFSPDQYPPMRYFIGDIRDRQRLDRAFREVDIVVHAAALKIVPTAEYNPSEVVNTNILGTQNIVNAAIDANVEKVIALSTDKAVSPVNLYGATKLCMEKVVIAGNSYVGKGRTRFGVVRYGNVLGSRGSVIPLFMKKRKEGVIPITDKRMTRFWITLEQGVQFVMDSLKRMKGGEVFIPKLPSMSIMDLAEVIAPGCDINIIGTRPGEKIHELLISKDEARATLEAEDHYIIRPPKAYFNNYFKPNGHKPVAEDFEYNSGDNGWLLSKDELSHFINMCVQDAPMLAAV